MITKEEFIKQFDNPMRVPRVTKLVINRGVGETREDPKAIDVSAKELTAICGQKPLIINAKKAIAGFKLKANLPIGLKVTLRNKRMHDFLQKLVNICLPKIRDFQGINPKAKSHPRSRPTEGRVPGLSCGYL